MNKLKSTLEKLKNPTNAQNLARYFKTGPGGYGEGDVFWGITLPQQRLVAARFWKEISFEELSECLKDEVHEVRLSAVIILTLKYPKADLAEKTKIKNFYLTNLEGINNWDLVDLSAPRILGEWLVGKLKQDRKLIYELAESGDLWRARVAILTTFAFIKNYDFEDSLNLAKYFLDTKEDLLQKAVGWMLREIGNRDLKPLMLFLESHSKEMPRTMLRYSLEKVPEFMRIQYMQK